MTGFKVGGAQLFVFGANKRDTKLQFVGTDTLAGGQKAERRLVGARRGTIGPAISPKRASESGKDRRTYLGLLSVPSVLELYDERLPVSLCIPSFDLDPPTFD